MHVTDVGLQTIIPFIQLCGNVGSPSCWYHIHRHTCTCTCIIMISVITCTCTRTYTCARMLPWSKWGCGQTAKADGQQRMIFPLIRKGILLSKYRAPHFRSWMDTWSHEAEAKKKRWIGMSVFCKSCRSVTMRCNNICSGLVMILQEASSGGSGWPERS